MRIILSRKGFDSATGGVASPILPDGRLCSLPIPEPAANRPARRYADVRVGDESLGVLVRDLTRGKVGPDDRAHLDPDLDHAALKRPPGWRPLFGQVGAAERHLQGQGVGPGDLFLFFGWFRHVAREGGVYCYVPRAPDLHVLWGWLQIGRRISVNEPEHLPPWAVGHPHAQPTASQRLDSLYVARERLSLPSSGLQRAGGGVWGRFDPQLCLTAPGHGRSTWRLPHWLYPNGRAPLTYHADPNRWQRDGDAVLLRSAAQGQEFVLDADAYPEALAWVASLLMLAPSAPVSPEATMSP